MFFFVEPSKLTPHEETCDEHGEADVLVSMQNLDSSEKDEQEAVDAVLPSELGWCCQMTSERLKKKKYGQSQKPNFFFAKKLNFVTEVIGCGEWVVQR